VRWSVQPSLTVPSFFPSTIALVGPAQFKPLPTALDFAPRSLLVWSLVRFMVYCQRHHPAFRFFFSSVSSFLLFSLFFFMFVIVLSLVF
jgi:hypothetical protein